VNGAETLAALADIELPAPPDWRPVMLLATALLLCAAAALIIHLRSRPRRAAPSSAPAAGSGRQVSGEALARLDRLRREWSSGTIDARAAAYRLGTLLRLGLGLPQLHAAAPPAGLDGKEWLETLALLQALRYAPASTQALTLEIFARAQRWLADRQGGDRARDV
jgi:hypothetical protein